MRGGVSALARLLLVSAAAALALLPVAAVSAAPRAKRKEHLVTLEWVGDIALSTQRGLPPGALSQALAPVRSFLRGVDETAGNLEGTLSVGGTSKCGGIGGGKCFAFQAPPSTAGQLRALGFDLMNIANNHALDYGYAGRGQTIAALRSAGIAYTGLPGGIAYRRVGGLQMAFLGFAPYSFAGDLLDTPAAQALVRRARAHAALVVVIIHAGAEGAGALHTPHGREYYLGEDRGNPRAFAHAVIDAGASIVLGSGPHVIRGIERYRGRVIAYSLGNFVGYHTLSGSGVLSQSGILRVTLGKNGRVLAGRWFSIRIVDGLPRPDPTNAAAKLVASLSRHDFPSDHFDIGPRGFFRIRR